MLIIGITPLKGRLVVSWSNLVFKATELRTTSQTGGFLVGKTMNTNQKLSFRKLYAFGKKLPIDLSLSENPLGCSPKVSMALKFLSQSDFFDYPDPDSSALRQAIAKHCRLDTECIFVSNGSEAIIKLLPQVVLKQKDEVIIPEVTFPMFEIVVKMMGNKVILSQMTDKFDIDLADIKNKLTNKTELIFLCNPNNPTGKVLKKERILNLVRSTNVLVVVDEANIEFGGETVINDVKRLGNLIVLRTFSKGFGLAGFRVGFCVANQVVIQQLKQISQPFPVSSVAQKAAITALNDRDFIKKTKTFMRKERTFLIQELSNRGFKVIESEANNLLVRVNNSFASSTEFVNKLNGKGVSVVNGTSFRGLGDKFIRVSPRLREVNKQFIKAVDEIIS